MKNTYNNVMLLSADDKAKLKFGEPTHNLATVQRNRQGIVPTDLTLAAADHDVHNKGSLTPSVVLNVDIPTNPDDSFYTGQVSVMLKDSIYEASTSFRAVIEMEKVARASTK